VVWTAVGGFGAGKIQYYRYVWKQSGTHTWTNTETKWSSGTIQTPPTSGGTWYLHVKGYNGADVGNGTYAYSVTVLPSPLTPTDDGASVDGTSAITWKWTDVSGEQGYRVKDTGGGNKSGDLSADTIKWQETGLTANTQYTRKIYSYNSCGESAGSTGQSQWTLQNTPTTPTFGTVTTNSIVLNTTGPLNLTAGDTGVYFDSTTTGGDGGINAWVQALTDTSTGLSTNTQYTYQVMAQNAVGTDTAYSGTASKYTAIEPVAGLTFSGITTNSISVASTNTPSNLISGSSGLGFYRGTDSINSGWKKDNTPWVSSGLSPNTQYKFYARTRNGDGETTDYCANHYKWTLSVPPTSGSVTPSNSSPCPNDPINWTAVGGFGAGKIQYYRYVWNQNETHSWTDTETQWSSGTIQTSPTTGGDWYLHVKGYNGADVGNGAHAYLVTALPAPVTPTDDTPFEDGTDTIIWTWFDVSDEQGYLVRDTEGNDMSGDLAANVIEWQETGLTANTQYTRKIHSFNVCGESAGSTGQSQWTLSVPPDEDSVATTSDSCAGDDVVWTAVGGFGAGKIQYYRYVWNQNETHSWTGSETPWSSGVLTLSATSGGTWYLHVLGYNGADVDNGAYSYAFQVKAGTEITVDPEDQNVVEYGTAVFTAAGTGAGTPSYQWQKYNDSTETWEDLDGETYATLEMEDVAEEDEGRYRCEVTAGCGSVETEFAELTLAPRILYCESVKTHGGGVGEIALEMPEGTPLVEPRRGDLLIRITFDRPVLADDGELDDNDLVIEDTAKNTYYAKAMAFNNGSQGNVLEITVDGAESNKQRLTLELLAGKFRRPTSAKAILAGVRAREVRCLVGNVTSSGEVDILDLSAVKGALFTSADQSNARLDVNLSGDINVVDMALVKSRIFDSVP